MLAYAKEKILHLSHITKDSDEKIIIGQTNTNINIKQDIHHSLLDDENDNNEAELCMKQICDQLKIPAFIAEQHIQKLKEYFITTISQLKEMDFNDFKRMGYDDTFIENTIDQLSNYPLSQNSQIDEKNIDKNTHEDGETGNETVSSDDITNSDCDKNKNIASKSGNQCNNFDEI